MTRTFKNTVSSLTLIVGLSSIFLFGIPAVQASSSHKISKSSRQSARTKVKSISTAERLENLLIKHTQYNNKLIKHESILVAGAQEKAVSSAILRSDIDRLNELNLVYQDAINVAIDSAKLAQSTPPSDPDHVTVQSNLKQNLKTVRIARKNYANFVKQNLLLNSKSLTENIKIKLKTQKRY